jgi:CheY-like chemotaxis protein
VTLPSGIAVLVVDDEPFVRMDIAEILQQAGFQVEEASNSDEALSKLNGGGYPLRVFVTDVQMPGLLTGMVSPSEFTIVFPRQ